MKLALRGIAARHASARPDVADALRDLDIGVDEGKAAAVIGPSGAGRATLLEVLACVRPPSQGSLEVGGADSWRLPRSRWSCTSPACWDACSPRPSRTRHPARCACSFARRCRRCRRSS